MTGCINSDAFVVVRKLSFAVVFSDGSDADNFVIARSAVSLRILAEEQMIDLPTGSCPFIRICVSG
jgi:hypothetical protein